MKSAKNATLQIGGTVTNIGEITVAGGPSRTILEIATAGCTLSGGGKVMLNSEGECDCPSHDPRGRNPDEF